MVRNHYNIKFLKGYGHSISVKNSKIILKDNHDPFSQPITEEWFVKNMPYDRIILQGKGYVSTEGLAILSENNKTVILLDTSGNPITTCHGIRDSYTATKYRMAQYDTFRDKVKTDYLTQQIIKAKLDSQIKFLKFTNRPDVREGIIKLSRPGLSEAVSSRIYFENYAKLIDERFQFSKRNSIQIQKVLGVSNQDMSEILTEMGREKGRNEEYDEGLKLFNFAIDYSPKNPSAHNLKGYALLDLLKEQQAITAFNQALKIDPSFVNATFGLADANYYLGDIKIANQLYKSGLEKQPNDLWGLAGYGISSIELGDPTGMGYIDKSLEIDDTFDVGIRDKLWGFQVLEEYEQYISYYNTLDEKYTEDPVFINNAGYSLQNLERYEEAKTLYKKALGIDPSDAYSRANLKDTENLIYQKNAQQLQANIELVFELTNQGLENDENGETSDAKKNFEQALNILELQIAPLITEPKAKEELNEKINEIKAILYEYEKDSIKIPTSSKGGGCLIATATYGSELAPQVQQLREIRDNSLLTTTSGIQFMNTFNDVYYSFSPVIADYERENPIFKEMVKIAITPMVSSLSILNYVDMDSESEVLGYGISLIILNGLMYVGIPIAGIVVIRKIF